MQICLCKLFWKILIHNWSQIKAVLLNHKYLNRSHFELLTWRAEGSRQLWQSWGGLMVPGHRSENHSPSSSGSFPQRWANTQRAGMEDGREEWVYQKHRTRHGQAHTQTQRAYCGRGCERTPEGSTIFFLCVVKLGRVPPTRPPFTEPLEEILLFLSPVLDGATLRQLHGTGELDLRLNCILSLQTTLLKQV